LSDIGGLGDALEKAGFSIGVPRLRTVDTKHIEDAIREVYDKFFGDWWIYSDHRTFRPLQEQLKAKLPQHTIFKVFKLIDQETYQWRFELQVDDYFFHIKEEDSRTFQDGKIVLCRIK
jgi:hypothetical protein